MTAWMIDQPEFMLAWFFIKIMLVVLVAGVVDFGLAVFIGKCLKAGGTSDEDRN